MSCICSEDFASGVAESHWDLNDALASESLSNKHFRCEVLWALKPVGLSHKQLSLLAMQGVAAFMTSSAAHKPSISSVNCLHAGGKQRGFKKNLSNLAALLEDGDSGSCWAQSHQFSPKLSAGELHEQHRPLSREARYPFWTLLHSAGVGWTCPWDFEFSIYSVYCHYMPRFSLRVPVTDEITMFVPAKWGVPLAQLGLFLAGVHHHRLCPPRDLPGLAASHRRAQRGVCHLLPHPPAGKGGAQGVKRVD